MADGPPIHELSEGAEFLRGFVIAHHGWGKTVFCGTAPKALFLTTDPEGTISAKALGSTAKEWRIRTWDDLVAAHRYLRDDDHPYEYVIIDNITEAQRHAMTRSMEITKKNSNAPHKLDEFVPAVSDYQRSQNMLIQMVLRFFDLPMHVIFTSHIKGMEDNEGEPFYSASIHGQQGSIADQILGYANLIGMGESVDNGKKEPIRRLWFSHSGPYRGKDRFVSSLRPYADNLTVPEMLNKINERERKQAAPARRRKPRTATTAKD